MVFLAGSNPARATINLMLMSRSFKKHPFTAVCCYFSNKKDKIIANRLFRRISKQRLKLDKDPLYSLKEGYCFSVYYNSKKYKALILK